MTDPRLALAAAVWAALWFAPLRRALEADMAAHMVVQVPLLIAAGLLLAPGVRRREPRALIDADWLGIPGLVLAVFVTSFWMLPRMLDRALSEPLVDLAKFLGLPLLGGLPLGLSWRRLPWLGRGFVWANFIPKLGAVGGLYLAAPTRLCAYYRLDQQTAAGCALIAVAAALAAATLIAVLAGWPAAVRPPRREVARAGNAPAARRAA